MLSILIGLLLVFFKTNLSFFEIGGLYYFTNIIGYLLIYNGLTELQRVNKKFTKIQPYVNVMIIHSILFFILNVTGNSPLGVELTSVGAIIGYLGFAVIIAGMFMIFYIIHRLIEVISEEVTERSSIKILDGLSTGLLLAFFFAGISFLVNVIPVVAETFMGILLLLKLVFLGFFFSFIFRKKERFV